MIAARAIWIWIKTMYIRITMNRTTTFFFLFAFLHCFAHGLVQSFLFVVDSDADSLASTITSVAQVPQNHFAWRTIERAAGGGEKTVLRLCSRVPDNNERELEDCVVVFDSSLGNANGTLPGIPEGFRKRQNDEILEDIESTTTTEPLTPEARTNVPSSVALALPIVDSASGNITGVTISVPSINSGSPIELDRQCTRVLIYADQVLTNSKREELALIGSEFWILVISVYAIMYDSIPHLLASIALRTLSTAWSAYSIWRTLDIRNRFITLLSSPTTGACSSIDLFPTYSRMRLALQIPDLLLNVFALGLCGWLGLRLARRYGSMMFGRVGLPEGVVEVYRYFLGTFVCLQLSVYLLVASAALWVDQLINGAIARISTHTPIYIGLFIFTLIVLLPWLAAGWHALRRESLLLLFSFLGIGFTFLSCWAIMYYSLVFRWTWLEWPFFASCTVAAQIVLVVILVLGLWVGWLGKGFGRGLKEFFEVSAALEKTDFEPDVFSLKFDPTGSFSSSPSSSRAASPENGSVVDLEKQNGSKKVWGFRPKGDKHENKSLDSEKERNRLQKQKPLLAVERLDRIERMSRLTLDLDFGSHQPAMPSSPPGLPGLAASRLSNASLLESIASSYVVPDVAAPEAAAVALGRQNSGRERAVKPSIATVKSLQSAGPRPSLESSSASASSSSLASSSVRPATTSSSASSLRAPTPSSRSATPSPPPRYLLQQHIQKSQEQQRPLQLSAVRLASFRSPATQLPQDVAVPSLGKFDAWSARKARDSDDFDGLV